jgi:hypothetical protein
MVMSPDEFKNLCDSKCKGFNIKPLSDVDLNRKYQGYLDSMKLFGTEGSLSFENDGGGLVIIFEPTSRPSNTLL